MSARMAKARSHRTPRPTMGRPPDPGQKMLGQRARHHPAPAIPGLLPALLDTGGWSSIAGRVCENTSSVSVMRPGALVITMVAQAWREAQVPQPGARDEACVRCRSHTQSPYLRVALQLLPHLSLPESLGH